MPKLSGVFNEFSNIDQISLDDINFWLKPKVALHLLDNYIANRIYYPQTIPVSDLEMKIDLAILREALRRENSKFYIPKDKKIIIPEGFYFRFYPTSSLIAAFIDALPQLEDCQVILQAGKSKKVIASVLIAKDVSKKKTVMVTGGSQKFNLKNGTLTLLPFLGKAVKIKIDTSSEIEVDGGEHGVFIDLRSRDLLFPKK